MTDTLCDGRRIRLLTVIDEGNREALDAAVEALTRGWQDEALMEALQGAGVPAGAVYRNAQVLDDLVHVGFRELRSPARHHGTNCLRRAANQLECAASNQPNAAPGQIDDQQQAEHPNQCALKHSGSFVEYRANTRGSHAANVQRQQQRYGRPYCGRRSE